MLPFLLDQGEDIADYAEPRARTRLQARLARFVANMQDVPQGTFEDIADSVRLPLGEVLAAPFSSRMAWLAAERGVETVHLEARAPVEWAKELRPQHPSLPYQKSQWHEGELHTAKYASFCQDEPHALYNPNHVSKWGVHELLHRAVGFYFERDLEPFSLYLASRLNEMLPVATWYGLEQCCRLNEQKFSAETARRAPNASPKDARWRKIPRSKIKDFVSEHVAALQFYFAHTEREFAAIDRERRTGAVVVVRHPEEPHLNASSDAVAYVLAHHARLRNERVTHCLLRYATVSRFASIASYAAQIRAMRSALVQPVSSRTRAQDLVAVDTLRQRRRVWDHALRAAHHSEKSYQSFVRTAPRALPDSPIALDGLERVAQRSFADGIASLHIAPPASVVAAVHEGVTEPRLFSRTPLRLRVAERSTSRIDAEVLRFEHAITSAEKQHDDSLWLADAKTQKSKARQSTRWLRSVAYQHYTFLIDPLEPENELETHFLIGCDRNKSVQVVPVSPAAAKWWLSLPKSNAQSDNEAARSKRGAPPRAEVVNVLSSVDAIRGYRAQI